MITPAGTGGSPVLMPATLGYRMVEASLDKQMAAFRNSGPVKREIDYFKSAIAKVDNADELVKDYRLFRFVLSAYGLDSQRDAKAFMKKVLEQDWSDADSLSNKLADSRYREIAKAFNFFGVGNANLKKSTFIDGLVDKYVTAEFEKNTEQTNPGVRLALYFKRMAPTITSWYQIMGDKPLYEVVRTALQIPAAGTESGVESQAKVLDKRIGLAKLKDPKVLESLIGRFLANYDRTNAPATLAVASLVQPLPSSATGGVSLGASTILGLASQKR
jgi:Protein of unknown function (DUF1217)